MSVMVGAEIVTRGAAAASPGQEALMWIERPGLGGTLTVTLGVVETNQWGNGRKTDYRETGLYCCTVNYDCVCILAVH